MPRPRSDPRSGASSHPEPDAAALRRELYRPGADRTTLETYLAAAEAEGPEPGPPGTESEPVRAESDAAEVAPAAAQADEPPAPPVERADGGGRRSWRRIALLIAAVVVVPTVGVALLPRAEPPPTPQATPTPSVTGLTYAPTRFDGLRGASTLLVGVPFRTNRVRLRLQCGGRHAAYAWRALGQDSQTQQFIPVLAHSGDNCSPAATYIGPLPGGVSALRIIIIVDGPYALSVAPL
jgi:hypothetical protein